MSKHADTHVDVDNDQEKDSDDTDIGNSPNARRSLSQRYNDRCLSCKMLLGIVPFVVLAIVSPVDEELSVWLALALSLSLNLRLLYRGCYDPKYPKWYWMEMALCLSLLGIGIFNGITGVAVSLLQIIPSTAMFLAIPISMMFEDPFLYRELAPTVTPDVSSSPGFMQLCQYLSAYWMFVMFLQSVSMWVSLLFLTSLTSGEPSEPIPYLILSAVLPIGFIILGFLTTKPLADYLKSKGEEKDGDEENGDVTCDV
ncbi:unnamed protein product [Pseudo-nitzschia multistriata]|uniref:Uncharacterized protein n=1 Tax=Pseudo-nitzschia multistriata TaxID=183589 RepID=A0A448YV10_9STRA|nr:unnamed protein product [Pseudo-nitzschia multistriata]